MSANLHENKGRIVVEKLAQLGDNNFRGLSVGVRSLWVSDDIIFVILKD